MEWELAEVNFDAWPRVGCKPVEGACRKASPTEGECLGEVEMPPGRRAAA